MLRTFGCLLAFALAFTLSSLSQTEATSAGAASVLENSSAQSIPEVPVPAVPIPTDTQKENFHQNVQDIHFDLNRARIRKQEQSTLQSNAQWLQAHPDAFITIEGDADERGDIVYNLFLSETRAQAARDALVKMGVPEKQILFATGWGKLYPVCAESDESCWAQNRRSHFALWGEQGAGASSTGGASH